MVAKALKRGREYVTGQVAWFCRKKNWGKRGSKSEEEKAGRKNGRKGRKQPRDKRQVFPW